MEAEIVKLAVELGQVKLLKKLVSEQLDRRCAAIDDIVATGYGEFIGKRAESNQEAVKAAILELVRGDLASLERSLAALAVEPEAEPEPEPEVKPEAEVKVEVKPEEKPGKTKA